MRTTRRSVVQSLAASGLAAGRLLGLPVAAAPGPRVVPGAIGPKAVTSVEGQVENAHALIGAGRARFVATRDMPATLVLDYQRIVGGRPVFQIESVDGAPVLTAIYSQALPWLMPSGDGPAPGKPGATAAAPKEISFVGFAGGANLSRTEQVPLRRGRVTSRLIQGGQRFQALRLSGSGSLTLSQVGFLPTFRQRPAHAIEGSFSCSDAALTEIWSLGAYALDVASLPAGAVPALWDITPEGATVYGDSYTGYQRGLDWRDYSVRFEVRIEAAEASWLIRAQPPDGIRLVLCADRDTLPHSTPNTLRIYSQFHQQLIATVPLPRALREGDWHRVQTDVRGSMVSVALDELRLGSFPIPAEGGFWGTTAAGWPALGNASGAIATFRNLRVAAPDGTTLLETPLTDASILDEFAAAQSTRATIVDGATRDRLLFTGDLGVAAQTLLYTSFDLAYLTQSIALFSFYQRSDGSIPTSIPPQANPGRTPGTAFASGLGDYTVQHISTIHSHWMHSADVEFLRRQWPVVLRVLDSLGANTAPGTGLFAPVARRGAVRRVAETLSNAHYYGALLQAADMAQALNEPERAKSLQQAAKRLREAINRYLFNEQVGLYGASSEAPGTIEQHANALAVLYRIPTSPIPDILTKLGSALRGPVGPLRSSAADGHIVSPYTSGYEVTARMDNGDTLAALDIIRSAWAPMRQGGAYYSGATWEYVDLQGLPGLGSGTSLAHPWSSGPTAALSAYVLGIRPLQPGFRTWLAEPQPGDLSWARGSVPTPHGPIQLEWSKRDAHLRMSVTVPAETQCFAGIPVRAGSARIEVNGRARNRAAPPDAPARPGYAYVGPLASGVHAVTESQD